MLELEIDSGNTTTIVIGESGTEYIYMRKIQLIKAEERIIS